MTAKLLRQIIQEHVLNPTPVGDEMTRFYVPFDDLFGKSLAEQPLGAAVEGGRRVGVVGPSGIGKSSLIDWVLTAPEDAFAAVPVPVAVERDETVTDPIAFAQHVIRTVSKYALDAQLIDREARHGILQGSSDRIARPAGERATSRRGGGGLWFLSGEIGREVRSFADTVNQDRSGAEILEALRYVIALLSDRGLRPVFVIDDSDTWLRIDGVKDRSALVNGFFDRVLRMLAELPAGLVVAVHDQYLSMPGYRQAEGFLETFIDVPTLEEPRMLSEMLGKRISAVDDMATASDVFADAAVEQLFGYYGGAASRSLRKTMHAAQRAVQLAAEEEAAIVDEPFVERAISDWV
jgi:hypothetical protein